MFTYPVKLNEIPKFEKVNHLKINVMTIDGKFVVPLQLSKSNEVKQIDLLYFNNHYFLIRSMDRLLSRQGRNKNFLFKMLSGI